MTVHIEQKGSTYLVLSVNFCNGTLFLSFDVQNFMSDELNMYL